MELIPKDMSAADFYRVLIQVITPRPIAWVSTLSKSGVTNLAPYSFSNGVSSNPPSHLFCPVNRGDGSEKDTLINARETGEYVCNVVPYALRLPMNESSADLPPEASEFDSVGVTAAPSRIVKPPRVKESPVSLECKVIQIVSLAEGPYAGHVIIGEIVAAYINDAVMTEGTVDPAKLDTIGRMGGPHYTRTTERFGLPRPGPALSNK